MSNHKQQQALHKLNREQLVLLQRHESTPCMLNPSAYTDDNPKTVLEAALLCADCPLFGACRGYAVSDKSVSGVWGGIFYPDPLESKVRSTKKEEDL